MGQIWRGLDARWHRHHIGSGRYGACRPHHHSPQKTVFDSGSDVPLHLLPSSPNLSVPSGMAGHNSGNIVKEDSGSSSDAPDDEELALSVTFQRSRLDTGGSSSSVASAANSSGSCRRNAGYARLSHGRPSGSAPLQTGRASPSPSPPAPAWPG